jgi:hypothetical protein
MLIFPADRELEQEVKETDQLLPDIETQNIIVLSLLLVIGKNEKKLQNFAFYYKFVLYLLTLCFLFSGLTTNLLAFPVILFRQDSSKFLKLFQCQTKNI